MYSRLAGYEDTNDAERLAVDPAMRQVVGGRARDRQAASTSQMGRFETEILTTRKNLKALMDRPGMWIDRVRQHRAMDKLIKIGAKAAHHARYVVFQMAEVTVPRKMFAAILERIQRLRAVESMAPS